MFHKPEARLTTRLPPPAFSFPGSYMSTGASTLFMKFSQSFWHSFGAKSAKLVLSILSKILDDRPYRGEDSTMIISCTDSNCKWYTIPVNLCTALKNVNKQLTFCNLDIGYMPVSPLSRSLLWALLMKFDFIVSLSRRDVQTLLEAWMQFHDFFPSLKASLCTTSCWCLRCKRANKSSFDPQAVQIRGTLLIVCGTH